MFQVTCIRDKTLAQAHPGPAAVRLKLQITLGIPHTVIMPTPLILSVRIRAEKAIKVGMPPAPLNLASKALISKSGPPHDHFNWAVAERCAEWLGLARGLFLTSYSETQLQTVRRSWACAMRRDIPCCFTRHHARQKCYLEISVVWWILRYVTYFCRSRNWSNDYF